MCGESLSPALFEHAQKLLVDVLTFLSPVNVIVGTYFLEHGRFRRRERSVLLDTIFSIVRRKLEFGHYAQSAQGSLERNLVLLGLVFTRGLKSVQLVTTPDEMAWLEQILQIDPVSLAPRVRSNLPSWIYQRLIAHLGELETEALAASMNQSAPLDCRVNLMKANRDDTLAALCKCGYLAKPTPFSPNGIRLVEKPELQKHSLFIAGAFEIQDEGSQLLCQLVAPRRGEIIVDFCAGAGGKTLAIGAAMRSTGRLYAFDVSEKRLSKLKPRLLRSGLSNVYPVVIDSEYDTKIERLVGKIDRVLVDVPCSGLGTLRRNPDMKWRQSPETVDELTGKQISILASASRLVKLGGRLVYATCSILHDENQEIVKSFLTTHLDFVEIPVNMVLSAQKINLDTGKYLELNPHRHGTDGFFAAVFERRRLTNDSR
ncbi:RsmB/NOP family class I SAM-dependent RNA methyltransferase [Candidatus Pandoraea novymonadis]|nr:RsmB/NOP family class I SAM-dependent RNA methyltransferase [Candidatus Pandoraea novymonadis]